MTGLALFLIQPMGFSTFFIDQRGCAKPAAGQPASHIDPETWLGLAGPGNLSHIASSACKSNRFSTFVCRQPGTFIGTFQENPCARMQNMYQSEDLRAPLPSRLFKRILMRECRKCLRAMVVQEPCHRHFPRESLCENKNCKNEKNGMSTSSGNP